MREVMPAHLAVVVGQSAGIGLGFRKQQEPGVFVGVRSNQNNFGRLKEFFLISKILDARHSAIGSRDDASYMRAIEDLQVLRLHRFGNSGDSGRVFGRDMAPAGGAVTVVGTPAPAFVSLR